MYIKSKILVLSQRFPPSVGGTPTVIKNLITSLTSFHFSVITLLEDKSLLSSSPVFLNAEIFGIKPVFNFLNKIDSNRYRLIINAILIYIKHFYKSKPAFLFCIYPGNFNIGAAAIISLIFNIRIVSYFFDYSSDIFSPKTNLTGFFYSLFRRKNSIYILLTTGLYDLFSGRFGLISNIAYMPHLVDGSYFIQSRSYNSDPSDISDPNNNFNMLLFTGQIHDSCLDTILNVIESIKFLSKTKFVITTPDPYHRLRKQGVTEKENVIFQFCKDTVEVKKLQSESSLLINPVSFTNKDAVQIKTLFPTKTIEYLLSGKPQLVISPDGIAFTEYVKNGKFAHLLTSNDPTHISDKIKRILNGDDVIEKRYIERELSIRSSKIAVSLFNYLSAG